MSNSPTLSYLLGQMAQDKEVLNGWDAVLNLLESSINTFFQAQFDQMTGHSGEMTISRIFCGPRLPNPHGDYSVVTDFSFTLGPPHFEFTGGSNTVTVTQAILSGSTRTGSLPASAGFDPDSCGCVANDSRVQWGQRHSIDLGNHPSMTAVVQLTTVTGVVDQDQNTHTVVLDFANGAFTANNVTIENVSSQQLSDQIKSWFMTHGVQYQVASLSFSGNSDPSLTPTKFQFKVLKTNSGNIIVQILIVTNGTSGRSDPIVLEPVPTADGYSCSLMINSRITFKDILCDGFNNAGKPFNLYPQSQSPTAGYTAYIAPQMHFSGSFSYGSCCNRHTVTYSLYLGGTYSGTAKNGFHLYQSITPSGNIGNTITVNADNPVSLSGSGESQTIRITPQPPVVNVTGGASSTINDKLKSILNDDFAAAMAGISFGPVSYFALRSVLFPGNLMKMDVVEVPTDLVIVGTFQPT
ncbi:hypothetical protein [Rhodospirillum sp. A1_3_36]|uniref:hypothetical protein n=1 Tax=Rhodospirillum sp. A1_3_36 TaxID=3391666 RepID=UPI0039A6A17F